jgi:2,4-dienoyl-CoA reductase-like NADH-dependent reductase (Old Yellow Enzyme family)
MSLLFTPMDLHGVPLRNRVWVSPMCQYSAVDGVPDDWHLVHLGSFARGGAGLVFTEATAVSPEGRISPADTGIWNDEQRAAWTKIADFIHGQGAACGMQLEHAGRKASTVAPFEGRGPVADADGGWEPVAPSVIPYPGLRQPRELTVDGIDTVVDDFVRGAQRALEAGFDVLEIHAAHGYLLHEFLSPLSNQREDEYGGSLENRMRFPLEVFDAVRAAFPAERPVTVRVSGTDWAEGGWTIEETVTFARALEARGCSAIHVSSGGLAPSQHIPLGPSYQVPLARAVRTATRMPVVAVGLITDFVQAEAILATGDADLIALARAILYDPRWPWHAAAHFGAAVKAPSQYLRSQPRQFPHLFDLRADD